MLRPVGFKIVPVNVQTDRIEEFAVNRGYTNGPASRIGGGGLERPIAARFDATDGPCTSWTLACCRDFLSASKSATGTVQSRGFAEDQLASEDLTTLLESYMRGGSIVEEHRPIRSRAGQCVPFCDVTVRGTL